MNEPLTMSMFASRKEFDAAAKRQKMVEACVRDRVHGMLNDRGFCEAIARQGCKGFASMTDDELEQAYVDAGLDEQDDLPWVIFSASENGYWHNDNGWVERSIDATWFSEAEASTVNLPATTRGDAQWVMRP